VSITILRGSTDDSENVLSDKVEVNINDVVRYVVRTGGRPDALRLV
jgi:hypothetical protein